MQTQQDKNTLTPVLTKQGRELLAKGMSTKKNYRISHVGVGPGGTSPDETELKDKIERVEVGGVEISDQHIHVTARIKSKEQYDIKDVGFYLSSVDPGDKKGPVLFALYSHDKEVPLLRTSPFSDLLLGFDLLMPEDIQPIAVTNNALFHLPIATDKERGIVQLATQADIVSNKDRSKAVTAEALQYVHSLATEGGELNSLQITKGGEVNVDKLKVRKKIPVEGETESIGIDTQTGVMIGAVNDYQKLQLTLSGGGKVTWCWDEDEKIGYLDWSYKFVGVVGKTDVLKRGFVYLSRPKDGTKILANAYGGGQEREFVKGQGIKLKEWEALYAVHRVGGDENAIDFKIIHYSKVSDLPGNWLLIGVVNGLDHTIKLGTGTVLEDGAVYIKGMRQGMVLMDEEGEVAVDKLKIKAKKTDSNKTESVGIDTGTSVLQGAVNDYQKAQSSMSCDGYVTWKREKDHGYLFWNNRFIAIGMGVSDSIPKGHINIKLLGGKEVEVYLKNGTEKRKIDAVQGLLLKDWEALYAVHRVGGTENDVRLKIIDYRAEFTVPSNWLLVGIVNKGDGTIKLGIGATLYSGAIYSRGRVSSGKAEDWKKLTIDSKYQYISPANCRKDEIGIVYLRGILSNTGNIGSGWSPSIGRLPQGYYPETTQQFNLRGSQSAFYQLKIGTDGRMYLSGIDFGSDIGGINISSNVAYLDNISFRAKQE